MIIQTTFVNGVNPFPTYHAAVAAEQKASDSADEVIKQLMSKVARTMKVDPASVDTARMVSMSRIDQVTEIIRLGKNMTPVQIHEVAGGDRSYISKCLKLLYDAKVLKRVTNPHSKTKQTYIYSIAKKD